MSTLSIAVQGAKDLLTEDFEKERLVGLILKSATKQEAIDKVSEWLVPFGRLVECIINEKEAIMEAINEEAAGLLSIRPISEWTGSEDHKASDGDCVFIHPNGFVLLGSRPDDESHFIANIGKALRELGIMDGPYKEEAEAWFKDQYRLGCNDDLKDALIEGYIAGRKKS